MLASLVGGLALMVAFIGVLGIYFTHKVAGPIYKMKGLLKRVGEGSLRVDSRLRRGDELQDFFDAFIEMVSSLRANRGAAARGRGDGARCARGRSARRGEASARARPRDDAVARCSRRSPRRRRRHRSDREDSLDVLDARLRASERHRGDVDANPLDVRGRARSVGSRAARPRARDGGASPDRCSRRRASNAPGRASALRRRRRAGPRRATTSSSSAPEAQVARRGYESRGQRGNRRPRARRAARASRAVHFAGDVL